MELHFSISAAVDGFWDTVRRNARVLHEEQMKLVSMKRRHVDSVKPLQELEDDIEGCRLHAHRELRLKAGLHCLDASIYPRTSPRMHRHLSMPAAFIHACGERSIDRCMHASRYRCM